MAVARFVMLACFNARLSIRRNLTCFEALKLNLLSASLLPTSSLMAKLKERGWNPTLQNGFTSSLNKKRKGSQERVKVLIW
jgi:hypothetical protein